MSWPDKHRRDRHRSATRQGNPASATICPPGWTESPASPTRGRSATSSPSRSCTRSTSGEVTPLGMPAAKAAALPRPRTPSAPISPSCRRPCTRRRERDSSQPGARLHRHHMTGRHYDGTSPTLRRRRAMRPEYAAIATSGMTCNWTRRTSHRRPHRLLNERVHRQGRYRRYSNSTSKPSTSQPRPGPDALRIHLCWGNSRVHHLDTPCRGHRHRAVPGPPAASDRAANPRHEHEWDLPRRHGARTRSSCPASSTPPPTFGQHPRLVAQRIERFAALVGKQRVLAGTDCGFGTFAGVGSVFADVAWLNSVPRRRRPDRLRPLWWSTPMP